ncbi:MAG: DUF882 domain-containing protein [Candidatus Krumholzibacteriota bacterium]
MGLNKSAFALADVPAEPSRFLSLTSVRTGEKVDQVYWSAGQYLPEGLDRINHLLRDFRTNQVKDIDTRLLVLLSDLASSLGAAPEFQVISGFRSPRTNSMLRRKSPNVARKSYHLLGKAVDIRMPAVPLKDLHAAALHLGQGGVGFYPGPDFIHVDVGPVRTW